MTCWGGSTLSISRMRKQQQVKSGQRPASPAKDARMHSLTVGFQGSDGFTGGLYRPLQGDLGSLGTLFQQGSSPGLSPFSPHISHTQLCHSPSVPMSPLAPLPLSLGPWLLEPPPPACSPVIISQRQHLRSLVPSDWAYFPCRIQTAYIVRSSP